MQLESKNGYKGRTVIIWATLLALFLGAMDALIVTAAMPSIISDLGGLHLYAWVYSAYFLARAVSLPVFGKLADQFDTKKLFLFSIGLFLLSSAAAGAAPSMTFLVVFRVFQGIGAGGNFALVYIVLSDVALPGKRAETLSLASSVWGISSVIGPTLGGFIVTWFSWRWIFYINVPLGIFCLFIIGMFLKEFRQKRERANLDLTGIALLTALIVTLLSAFITAGRDFAWNSIEIRSMLLAAVVMGICFFMNEKRAADPVLNPDFFKIRGFAIGNGAAFFSSFAIFALFAYAPLFIQGALSKSPLQVGIGMLSLSLGWSVGSLILGRMMHIMTQKSGALAGAAMLTIGSLFIMGFSMDTTMTECFFAFLLMGLGMGFVTLSTLLTVQASLPASDLGVSTSTHQFARTLGGTIGVGICGGVATSGLMTRLDTAARELPPNLLAQLSKSMEAIFSPEFQAQLTPETRHILEQSVASGLDSVFFIACAASIACLALSCFLPPQTG